MQTKSDTKLKKKNNTLGWLLWWKIDKEEIERQIKGYKTFKVTESARGQSTLLLLFSVILTVGLVLFANYDSASLFDAGLMLIIAFFVYRGHRWAMIGALLYWTFAKSYAIYTTVNTNGSGNILLDIVWWVLYMHVFYLAYKVEGLRLKDKKKFCSSCGNSIDSDSKFCVKCGAKINAV
jgi:ribosomal protein S27AE